MPSPGPGSSPPPSRIRLLTAFSVYELNLQTNQVRRMAGLNPPTERQGADGQWQQCADILFDNDTVLFVWGMNPDGSARCTRTSHIVSVEEIKEVSNEGHTTA